MRVVPRKLVFRPEGVLALSGALFFCKQVAGILIRHGSAVTPSPTWGRQGLCEHSAHIGGRALKKPSPVGEGGPRSGG